MEPPNFGQIAYEAYSDASGWKGVLGDSLPQWAQMDKEVQAAWSKAAAAVLKEADEREVPR